MSEHLTDYFYENKILFWNLSEENPSIGGLLTKVTEANMLRKSLANRGYTIPIVSSASNLQNVVKLAKSFENAFTNLKLVVLEDSQLSNKIDTFGFLPQMVKHGAESYSTLTVQELWKRGYGQPTIPWNAQIKDKVLRSFKNVISVHLRQVSGGDQTKSDANFEVWRGALSRISKNLKLDILLIGDDWRPQKFVSMHGFQDSTKLGLSLVQQLVLTGESRCFVGMASGLAAAAIFSDNPYLIFKHPMHHKNAMDLEIGNKSQFIFASQNQYFVRAEPSSDLIYEYMGRIIQN